MADHPDETTAPRLLTARFVAITAATLAYFTAVGATIPVLPRFVRDELGGGGLEVGIAVGAFAVSAAALRPYVGRLGDRRGRRILVVGGSAIVAASFAGYHLASTLLLLVVLRLVTGVGEAAMFVGAATAAQDLAPAHRRGEAASYFSVALYGGLALGPLLGEAVFKAHGVDAVWTLAAGLGALGALIGLLVPVGRLQVETGPRRFLHPAAVLPGSVLFLGLLGFAAFSAFVPLYVDDMGLDSAGPVFTLYGVLVLLVRLFGARIPDRFGAVATATSALVAIAVGMLVVFVVRGSVGLYAGTVFFSVGMSLLFPAMFALVVNEAPEAERSHAVGTFSLFFDLSQGLGAAILGGVVALTAERGAFVAAAVSALAGIVLLRTVVAARTTERTVEPVPA